MREDLDTEAIVEAYRSGLSASALAKRHRCSTWSIITRLRLAGVRVRSNKEQNEKRLDLTSEQQRQLMALLDGILLSDGYLHKKGALYLEQARRRQGWIRDIAKRLAALEVSSRLITIPPRARYIDGRRIRSTGSVLLYTPCYVECQEQRARWYPRGNKRVPSDLILAPITIAYWLCGDGTYTRNGTLSFCTNSFLKKEVERLAVQLTALGIEARCVPASRPQEYYVVVARRDAAQALKELVEPFMPECCRYKLRFVRPTLSPEEIGTLHRKLTHKQIKRIRSARTRGTAIPALAARFNVSITTIYNALRRDVGA